MRQMMWSKIRISEIRNDAFESLKYKDDNAREKSKTYVLYMYVLPLLVSVLLLVAGIFITNDIATYLITSISIFAGLFFGLLFIVTERYNAKNEQLKKNENEEVRNYLIRYKNFSKFLIRQISYTIVLALLLIFLMAVIYFSPQVPRLNLCGYGDIIRTICKYAINGVIYYWSFQFIIFILVILGNTYVMLSDDINNNTSK